MCYFTLSLASYWFGCSFSLVFASQFPNKPYLVEIQGDFVSGYNVRAIRNASKVFKIRFLISETDEVAFHCAFQPPAPPQG